VRIKRGAAHIQHINTNTCNQALCPIHHITNKRLEGDK